MNSNGVDAVLVADVSEKGPESPRTHALDLFLVSFALLFFEQAFIRWLPAHIRLLGYFANFILLAAFLGMGLGMLRSGRRPSLFAALPILLGAALILNLLNVSVRIETDATQIFFFGADRLTQQGLHVPFGLILILCFVVIAVFFTGPGQAMGELFDRLPPLRAYSVNLAGSMAGILCFMGASALSLSPVWWFGAGGLAVLWLLRKSRRAFCTSTACLVLALFLVYRIESEVQWSPYYRLGLSPHPKTGYTSVIVNSIWHQVMLPASHPSSMLYEVPYLLKGQGRGKSTAEHVLVIGAGTGNDVSHALLHGAKQVDAVEIDPLIQQIGRVLHPNSPYADPRVRGIVDDGRSFLRRTSGQYDMILYGLVDSLTLMSQFGAIRLENYLLTADAFRDAKQRLAPNGLLVVYNYYSEPWLAARILRVLQQVFGPDGCLLITLPPRAVLEPGEGGTDFAVFVAGDVAPIRAALDRGAITLQAPPPDTRSIPLFAVREVRFDDLRITTDDWPFPYLRQARIPAHTWQGAAIVVLLSFLLLFGTGGVKPGALRPHFFLLGAAFLLLETHGIARLALLFGSTWINNSLTFLGILALALLANLVAARRSRLPYGWLYAGLMAALLIEYLVPLDAFLSLPPAMRTLAATVLLFLPVFFSGMVFARSFRESRCPHQDLGSNILGAVVGGCLENLSILVGYHGLVLLIVGIYALSALALSSRSSVPAPVEA